MTIPKTKVTSTAAETVAFSSRPGWFLVLGIMAAAIADAFAGTALSLGRMDLLGDTHATPDQFVWLDISYTVAKFMGFFLTPWLVDILPAQTCLWAAVGLETLLCGMAIFIPDLQALVVLRTLQGLAGGVLLVAGQSIVFQAFSKARQPLLQGLFAIGAVVAPATLIPAVQGWMTDRYSWTWIFGSSVVFCGVAMALLFHAELHSVLPARRPRLPWLSASLYLCAISCLTYVMSQGNRYNWLDDEGIVWCSCIGIVAIAALCMKQAFLPREQRLLRPKIFHTDGFPFGVTFAFIAGIALFGSAEIIPAFAVEVLGFSATAAGLLLLPSGFMFLCSLMLTVYLVQKRGVDPNLTVPFGLVLFMGSMWLLSHSNAHSGVADLGTALLLRGTALGFLFLSLILISLLQMRKDLVPTGVAMFDTSRQIGGLVGVAGLGTWIEHRADLSLNVFDSHLTPESLPLQGFLSSAGTLFTARGLPPATSMQAASGQLAQLLRQQAMAIGYDAALTPCCCSFWAPYRWPFCSRSSFIGNTKPICCKKHRRPYESLSISNNRRNTLYPETDDGRPQAFVQLRGRPS